MPLKNMKMSIEEKKDGSQKSIITDTPDYPYGLSIEINPDVFEKLELSKDLKVGDKKALVAQVEVTRISKEPSGDDMKKMSASFQITDMAIEENAEKKVKEAGEAIYGES